MYYYARPYSYNPDKARYEYWQEVEKLQETTGETVISTIPLTLSDNIEHSEYDIFKLAEAMIKQCKGLIFKSSSMGTDYEIGLAKKHNIPHVNYWEVIKKGVEKNG